MNIEQIADLIVFDAFGPEPLTPSERHARIVRVLRSDARMAICGEVDAERAAQDRQWGGSRHDDSHTTVESRGACWHRFIGRQSDNVSYELTIDESPSEAMMKHRTRYVKMAALAFAGIESIDRLTPVDAALRGTPRT